MTTQRRYAIPVEGSTWQVPNAFETVFRWEYEDGRDALMSLYEKGKKLQWNTNVRIDWSQDLDPENPQELPDESVSIFGSPVWEKCTRQEKATLRRHLQAWQLSQFLQLTSTRTRRPSFPRHRGRRRLGHRPRSRGQVAGHHRQPGQAVAALSPTCPRRPAS